MLGTMLAAAARARRKSPLGCGASSVFWSPVYPWIVVINPSTTVKLSCNALAIGAKQLVVHEAPEITVSVPSKISWFTL